MIASHASAARFAQALRQTVKLLVELWLQPNLNRHSKKLLDDWFNGVAARCLALLAEGMWIRGRAGQKSLLFRSLLSGHWLVAAEASAAIVASQV